MNAMKTGKEKNFQQLKITLDTELVLIEEKLLSNLKRSKERVNQSYTKLQVINKLYFDIENELRSNKSLNSFEVRTRVDRCRQDKDKIKQKIDSLNERISREELFKAKSVDTPKDGNEVEAAKIMMNLNDRYHEMDKNVDQTYEVVKDTKNEVQAQGRVIQEIGEEADAAEGEIGMLDQLMRIINNRQLITRLVLLFLVIFLGVSDLIILLLKIG